MSDFTKIFVGGEVVQPQLIDTDASVSLTEAIAYGTGLTTGAKRNACVVRKTLLGEFIVLSHDLIQINSGKVPDPPVEKGSIVFVPSQNSLRPLIFVDDPIPPHKWLNRTGRKS